MFLYSRPCTIGLATTVYTLLVLEIVCKYSLIIKQAIDLNVVIVVVVVVSPIQRIGCQPEKLLYTVANPARGLLNREKRTKEEVWQHNPPRPPTLLVRRK